MNKNKEELIRTLQDAIKEIESMPENILIMDVRSNTISEIYFSDIGYEDGKPSVFMYLGWRA